MMKIWLFLMGFLSLMTGPWVQAMENPNDEELQHQSPYFGYERVMRSMVQDAQDIQEGNQRSTEALKAKGYQLVHSLQLDIECICLLENYLGNPDQVWVENKKTYYSLELLLGNLRKCAQRKRIIDQIGDFAKLTYEHTRVIGKLFEQNKNLGDPTIAFLEQEISSDELVDALSLMVATLKVKETYPDCARATDTLQTSLSHVETFRRDNGEHSFRMHQLIQQDRVTDEDHRRSFVLDLLEEVSCANLMNTVLEISKIQFLHYLEFKGRTPELSRPRFEPYGIDIVELSQPSAMNAQPSKETSKSSVIIYRSEPEDFFVLPLIINGHSLSLPLDMTKPVLLLSRQDARRIGADLDDLKFTATFEGDNGARLSLRQIRLGEFVFSDVKALVMENLEKSLVGRKLLENMKVDFKENELMIRAKSE